MTAEVKEGIQHLAARRVVEFYLDTKGKIRSDHNFVNFRTSFIKENKLEKRFHGHSYDIVTQDEIIEIDDLSSHPKKSHLINDGIAEKYIREFHPRFKFYRLLKEEIVDRHGRLQDPEDVANYLKENLF